MKGLFKQNRLFYTLLFSYLLLLGVTLTIINGFFGRRINVSYQAVVMERVEADMTSLRDTLDDELRQMCTTANQFRLLDSNSQYHFEQDPLGSKTIKAILTMFTLTNRIADDIIFIPADQQYLFTSSTTCRVDFFSRELFAADHLDPATFVAALREVNHLQAFAVHRNKREAGVAIAVPLLTDYATVSGVFLFFISDTTLQNMIKPLLKPYNASLHIRDRDGNLLFSYGALPSHEETFDFILSSDVISWSVAVHIFAEQPLLDELNRLARTQQASTIIALLVVSLLIFLLMFMNYTPIRKLQKIAGAMINASSKKPRLGELEEIAHTLYTLQDQTLLLTEKVERARQSEQNIILQRLLSGKFATIDEFNVKGTELSLSLTKPYFVVVSIYLQEVDTDIEELAELITDELPDWLDNHYVFTPFPNRIHFINSMRREEVPALVVAYETMRKAIYARTGIALTVGVGSAYQETGKIVHSFLESRTALDYRFVKGVETTIVFEEVFKHADFKAPYPKALLDQLNLALKSSDNDSIEERTDQLIDYLKQDNIPLFFARSISLDIIRLFVDHLPPSLLSGEEGQKNIFLLSDIDTIEKVIHLVLSVKDTLILCEKPRQAELDEEQMLEIIAYVKEHCYAHDFSMEQVADHFSLHLSTLSVKFKEYARVNFLDYVTALRMDLAKHLLRKTDLPLKDVSLQVGYYNLSSFIRRFKQIHTITPGEYRKIQPKD